MENETNSHHFLMNQALNYVDYNYSNVLERSSSHQRKLKEYRLFYYFFAFVVPVVIGMYLFINGVVSYFHSPKSYGSRCNALYGRVTFGYAVIYTPILVSGTATLSFLIMIRKTSRIVRVLVQTLENRIKPAKRLSRDWLQKFFKGNPTQIRIPSCQSFRRDAFERFFLVKNIVENMSEVLKLPIACILLFSATLFLYYGSISIIFGTSVFTTNVLWIISSGGIFFFTTSQIAAANSANDEFMKLFRHSTPSSNSDQERDGDGFSIQSDDEFRFLPSGDFEIIGARDMWLSLLGESPIYWTIYGFALTPKWLKTLTVGAITLVLAAVIPAMSSLLIP